MCVTKASIVDVDVHCTYNDDRKFKPEYQKMIAQCSSSKESIKDFYYGKASSGTSLT